MKRLHGKADYVDEAWVRFRLLGGNMTHFVSASDETTIGEYEITNSPNMDLSISAFTVEEDPENPGRYLPTAGGIGFTDAFSITGEDWIWVDITGLTKAVLSSPPPAGSHYVWFVSGPNADILNDGGEIRDAWLNWVDDFRIKYEGYVQGHAFSPGTEAGSDGPGKFTIDDDPPFVPSAIHRHSADHWRLSYSSMEFSSTIIKLDVNAILNDAQLPKLLDGNLPSA
jgi:hypothetical protein